MDYFKLANGFDVVLKKRTHASNVAVRLVVGVGQRHFPCGKQETPHFLEHLLSMGTAKHTEPELRKLIEIKGGHLNGFTRSTVTDYQIDIYDRYLPVAISTLHEMMTDTVITPQTIESARSVIFRERKGQYPWLVRWLYEMGLFKNAAAKSREVMLPGVQCRGIVTPDGITEEDVTEIYASYYVPSNMTLVVVGNFDQAKLVSQVKDTFGKLPNKPGKKGQLISPPYSMNGTKEVSGILSPFVGSEGAVAFGYRTMGRWSPDFYPLTLLAKHFRLLVLERVRFKEAMAYAPAALYHAEDDFGMFAVAAGASLKELNRVETLLEGGVRWLKTGWITAEELQALKDATILELAISHESNGSVADYYVSSLSQLKTDGQLADHKALIEQITPEDIHRVANRYLQNDSRVIARETPTLTFTQFFAGLGFFMLAVPSAGFYFVRRFLKRRRSRAMERPR